MPTWGGGLNVLCTACESMCPRAKRRAHTQRKAALCHVNELKISPCVSVSLRLTFTLPACWLRSVSGQCCQRLVHFTDVPACSQHRPRILSPLNTRCLWRWRPVLSPAESRVRRGPWVSSSLLSSGRFSWGEAALITTFTPQKKIYGAARIISKDLRVPHHAQ